MTQISIVLTAILVTAQIGCADKSAPRGGSSSPPANQSKPTDPPQGDQSGDIKTADGGDSGDSTKGISTTASTDDRPKETPAGGIVADSATAGGVQRAGAGESSQSQLVATTRTGASDPSPQGPRVAVPVPREQPQPSATPPPIAPAAPVPTPQPAAPGTEQARALTPPTTPVAAAFFRLVDSNTSDMDALDQLAGEVTAEVFNEDDQIRAKVWEIQNLVRERSELGVYTPQIAERVRLLETGLASTAAKRELWGIGEDAAIVLGSALAISVLRGYDFQFNPVQTGRAALHRTGEALGTVKDTAAQFGSGIRNVFRGRSTREAGARVEGMFSRMFRRLTPDEKFDRNLSRLGLRPMEVNLIRENMVPIEPSDLAILSTLRYNQTNVRGFRMMAYRRTLENENIEFFVFRQRVGGSPFRRQYVYFQTRPLPPEDVSEIVSKVFHGTDRRRFVEIADLPRGRGFRGAEVFDRLRTGAATASESAKSTIGNVFSRMYQGFNPGEAAEAFVKSGALIGGGYVLGVRHNFNYPHDIFLESLIDSDQPGHRNPHMDTGVNRKAEFTPIHFEGDDEDEDVSQAQVTGHPQFVELVSVPANR